MVKVHLLTTRFVSPPGKSAINSCQLIYVAAQPTQGQVADLTSNTVSPAADISVADNAAIKPSIERSYSMFRIDFDGHSESMDYSTPTLRSTTTGSGQYEVSTNKGCFLREAVGSILLSEDTEIVVILKDGKKWEMEFENRKDAIAVASDLAA